MDSSVFCYADGGDGARKFMWCNDSAEIGMDLYVICRIVILEKEEEEELQGKFMYLYSVVVLDEFEFGRYSPCLRCVCNLLRLCFTLLQCHF